ncbi:MAG: hypothetical protein MJY43_05760 [Bacteroidales bacterium]|nr:hypothetical protein [Bacteroidales bacterium]
MKYEDIIDIPHWDPKRHPRMSPLDRAAQFAPFAALTGYEAMVSETSRLTGSRQELDEERMMALNAALTGILERIGEHPEISVTWFRKDARKDGGEYVVTQGTVRDVEIANRLIVFREGERVSLDEIYEIRDLTRRDSRM